MEDNLITVFVEHEDGSVAEVQAPTDMGLSLMEVLKGSDYPILATCGGMALCGTCCIDILDGADKLHEMQDMEGEMLDSLPDTNDNSRLACQLQINEEMDGLRLKLHPQE